MAQLPYSRVVNVTLSRNDAFPSRRGFGTPLILSTVSSSGKVDGTTRTKLYASMEELAEDWLSSTDVYKAGNYAFAQNPRPTQIKVGYVALDETPIGSELVAQLDSLYAFDSDWYFVTIDTALRDKAYLDDLIEWVEAKNKLAILDSNAVATQTANDTTAVAGRNKGTCERTGVFYHPDAAHYGAVALAAKMGTFNFDNANSAYTAKFKDLALVAPINLGSAAVTAITGFTPGVGQSNAAGNMANTYINVGGRNFVAEGSTLTANVFLDEIHASDWIIARTEEEALGILLNNPRVPFTDQGLELIATAARTVMQQATRAGLVAQDLNPLTGDYEPAVDIIVPSVFSVPESQRKARIAPAIQVRFRYAGAIHYTTINYTMTF